jgi:hypothetical protein
MKNKERGSLALEQVLFISAIVLLGGAVGMFYDRLGNYFKTLPIPEAGVVSSPTNQ